MVPAIGNPSRNVATAAETATGSAPPLPCTASIIPAADNVISIAWPSTSPSNPRA